MIRRLATLLVLTLGLVSVSVPASACAALMADHHCCGGEQPPPCGECPAPAQPDAAPCASAPTAVAATAALTQIEAPAPDQSGAAGPAPALIIPAAGGPATTRRPAPARASQARAAPSIYLVTARLRL